MPLWFLNKITNTAEIYGSVSAFVQNEGIGKKTEGRIREDFSRKKLNTFETDDYRLERKKTITTKSKTADKP